MSQNQAAGSKIRILTGKLVVIGQDIAIDGGPILAICSAEDELASAVRAYGDLEGEEATVTGTDGFVGGLPVFCVSSLTTGSAAGIASVAGAAAPAIQKSAPKKSAKRASRKKS